MTTVMHCRGVVLLALLLIMSAGGALLMAYNSPALNARLLASQESGHALAAAREALLAYALNYADNYGHNTRGGVGRLPCPADERHSKPVWKCDANNIGYLPALWTRDGKIMDIDYLERFLDRDLWYAVAPDFRFNPSYNPLSATGVGDLLRVDDIDDVAAVIIDPGPPLHGQHAHRPGSQPGAYLEGENADGDAHFSVLDGNDRLLWIGVDQLMPLIERRVLGIVRDWLIEYKTVHGRYPYASAIGDGDGACVPGLTYGHLSMQRGDCAQQSFGEFVSATVPEGRSIGQTWFTRNGWPQQIIYRVEQSCVGAAALSDCDGVLDPPHSLRVGPQPVQLLLITAGAEIVSAAKGAMQNRQQSAELIEYLDTPALLSAEEEFPWPRPAQQANDQMLFVPQPGAAG